MAKESKSIPIDFSGVEKEIKKGGGQRTHVPEGDYLVKIVEHEMFKPEGSKKSTGIRWKFQIVEPKKYKGKTLGGFTSMKTEALWSLRNLIHAALGKNVAGKSVNFNPTSVYGKIVGAVVEDNEYTKDGKVRITSQVSTCFPKDEYTEAEDEDDDDETEDDEDEETEVEEEDDEELDEVEVEDL